MGSSVQQPQHAANMSSSLPQQQVALENYTKFRGGSNCPMVYIAYICVFCLVSLVFLCFLFLPWGMVGSVGEEDENRPELAPKA